jgi:hypothetical protein
MLPTQWVTIGTDVLTIILAILGFVDHTWHTSLLMNPITLGILGILGAIGIHQTVTTPTSATTKSS